MSKNLILSLALGAAAGVFTAAASAQTAGEAQTAAAMSAPTVKPGDADGAFVTGGKFSEPDGDTLYRRVCAGCHMPDARGVSTGAGFYPALAGNPKLSAGAYPVTIVLKGLHGMPPVGAMMSDDQVAMVVNHVRSHFGNRFKDKVSAADVKALR
ncbi:MAG: cytochrome c [Sphingomonadales bacterium]|nr:cytochrome c [Sphingomonadales bacterium]